MARLTSFLEVLNFIQTSSQLSLFVIRQPSAVNVIISSTCSVLSVYHVEIGYGPNTLTNEQTVTFLTHSATTSIPSAAGDSVEPRNYNSSSSYSKEEKGLTVHTNRDLQRPNRLRQLICVIIVGAQDKLASPPLRCID